MSSLSLTNRNSFFKDLKLGPLSVEPKAVPKDRVCRRRRRRRRAQEAEEAAAEEAAAACVPRRHLFAAAGQHATNLNRGSLKTARQSQFD